MKKRIFFTSLILTFAILLIWAVSLFQINDQDKASYFELTQIKKKPLLIKEEPIHQKRVNVQKDIYYLDNGQRLHFSIFSKDSFLTIKETKGKFEMVENLKNIKCLGQEKISYNESEGKWEQKLKYFTAENGTYTFPKHQFLSDTIELYFYDIDGEKIPATLTPFSPYLKGVASEVSFILSEKKPEFKAYHFKASFDSSKELE